MPALRPLAITCLALAPLPGCMPFAMSYVALDGPVVSYQRYPCYDGAPVGVAYERGGIRFAVALEPHGLSTLKEPFLKVAAPRNATVTIPEPTARLRFKGEAEGKSTSVTLQPAPLDWQGPYVAEMRRKSPLVEHRFVIADLPPIQSPGTLELPAVFVDGVAVYSPVLAFERRSWAGIVPVNC